MSTLGRMSSLYLDKKDRSDLIQHQEESFGIKYDPEYFF